MVPASSPLITHYTHDLMKEKRINGVMTACNERLNEGFNVKLHDGLQPNGDEVQMNRDATTDDGNIGFISTDIYLCLQF